ncbi:MAG: 2'-5' RNA ligase family protein [Candidatus Hodarchaeota archaeon]
MDFWTGIIVCFDDQSTKRLIELRKVLNDSPDLHGRAYVRVPPHITLFEHEELRKQEYYDALESAISRYNSFSLEFTGLTTFPATHVFYLNPKYSSNLHSLRKLCLETLENQGVVLDRNPDSMWSPHVTLLLELPTQEISKAVELSQNYLDLQIKNPFIAKISHIELFSYPPYKAEKKFFLHNTAEYDIFRV